MLANGRAKSRLGRFILGLLATAMTIGLITCSLWMHSAGHLADKSRPMSSAGVTDTPPMTLYKGWDNGATAFVCIRILP